ncbi:MULTISPECIES: acyl carrier protein [unclassified Streptomyces]|uniref:acyl carrier protein n=1 Tax=unclassified Streptomyces TaxID=2593676 RepID=UPI002E2E393A|nr:phosphopantetheine-binding protein [Streptomyces sp. NBC_01439]
MWDDKFEDMVRGYLPFFGDDEAFTSDIELRDLGLDSLGTVELLAQLENAYDVRFQDDALSLETFRTPGVLWKALSGLLQPAA